MLTWRSDAGDRISAALDEIVARWAGPRWKFWSFVAGLASLPLVMLAAYLIAVITGERFLPLALLILVAVILGASLVGSGFIEKLSAPLTRGGLARESADLVERSESEIEREHREQRDREARDRRTIRSGLFVLSPIVAFVYLMTII